MVLRGGALSNSLFFFVGAQELLETKTVKEGHCLVAATAHTKLPRTSADYCVIVR